MTKRIAGPTPRTQSIIGNMENIDAMIDSAPVALMEPPAGPAEVNGSSRAIPAARKSRPTPKRFTAEHPDEHAANRQAELFYLQKQIQQQTPMIFIMEDGARVQGVIEWYDRNSIKVRGKSRVLVFKSAIKYLYKAGEIGAAPGE